MKRNIVLYISQLADGGAERVMTLLANELTVKNYRVILVTTYHRENEYPVEKDVERIVLESVDSVQNGFRKNIGYILKLREICRNNQADVVISFLREPNVRALLATIGTGTKNIISVRSNPLKEYGGITERIIRRFLFPLADGCVFQTEDAKKAFPERLNKKSRVILSGKSFYYVKG